MRPLGFGEIFDRAVTVYVRHFVPIAFIALAVALPNALAQFGAMKAYGDIIRIWQHGGSVKTLPDYSGQMWAFQLAGVGLLLMPFAYAGLGWIVAHVSSGNGADWRSAYREAFARGGYLLATAIIMALIIVAAFVVGYLALILFAIAGVMAYTAVHAVGILLFVLAGAVLIGWALLVMLLQIAWSFAIFGSMLESLGIGASVRTALARIFNRREAGRAILFGLSMLAIYAGIVILAGGAAAAGYYFWHVPELSAAVSSVLSFLQVSFIGVLMVVYYLDVRVRRDGIDLQTDMERLRTEHAV